MTENRNESGIPSEASIATLEAFFASAEFQRFLVALGREDDRFDSLNSVVRATRRVRELLEEEEHLFAFLWQRELGLMALKYLLWDENELSRTECATTDPATVVRRSVDSGLLGYEVEDLFAEVFEYDLFGFDPENRPFVRLERLEADERLERATTRMHRELEESIEETFDELKGT